MRPRPGTAADSAGVVLLPLAAGAAFGLPLPRTAALLRRVPTLTTVFGAKIIATAIESMRKHGLRVRAMQDFHAAMEKAPAR